MAGNFKITYNWVGDDAGNMGYLITYEGEIMLVFFFHLDRGLFNHFKHLSRRSIY